MKIPKGKTEREVLEAIEKAISLIASSFVFGYFDIDDIKQFGRLEAIKLLDKNKYNPSRPLENYIYTHVKRRLLNLRRNKLRRSPPCEACHFGTVCGRNGAELCKKYQVWVKKNQAKSSLMQPHDLDYISDENEPATRCESAVGEEIETTELLRKIDEHLPANLREAYLKMRDGVSVTKALRLEVEAAVGQILGWENKN